MTNKVLRFFQSKVFLQTIMFIGMSIVIGVFIFGITVNPQMTLHTIFFGLVFLVGGLLAKWTWEICGNWAREFQNKLEYRRQRKEYERDSRR